MFSTGYGALNRSLGVTQHQSRQYMENMQNISLREQSSANTRPTVTVRAVAAGRLSSCQKYLHSRPRSGSSYAPLCLQVSHNLNSLKELLQSRRIILFERFHISSQTALTHQPPKGQRGSFSYKHIFLSRPALALCCTDLWNKTPSPLPLSAMFMIKLQAVTWASADLERLKQAVGDPNTGILWGAQTSRQSVTGVRAVICDHFKAFLKRWRDRRREWRDKSNTVCVWVMYWFDWQDESHSLCPPSWPISQAWRREGALGKQTGDDGYLMKRNRKQRRSRDADTIHQLFLSGRR